MLNFIQPVQCSGHCSCRLYLSDTENFVNFLAKLHWIFYQTTWHQFHILLWEKSTSLCYDKLLYFKALTGVHRGFQMILSPLSLSPLLDNTHTWQCPTSKFQPRQFLQDNGKFSNGESCVRTNCQGLECLEWDLFKRSLSIWKLTQEAGAGVGMGVVHPLCTILIECYGAR